MFQFCDTFSLDLKLSSCTSIQFMQGKSMVKLMSFTHSCAPFYNLSDAWPNFYFLWELGSTCTWNVSWIPSGRYGTIRMMTSHSFQ